MDANTNIENLQRSLQDLLAAIQRMAGDSGENAKALCTENLQTALVNCLDASFTIGQLTMFDRARWEPWQDVVKRTTALLAAAACTAPGPRADACAGPVM